MERLPAFDRPIAHRGFHAREKGVIENSLSAFAAAVENGYAMECDVQLSGDGKGIVFHDDTLERLTGHKGTVSTLSAGQLERIRLLDSAASDCPPRFEALLEQVKGQQLLVVEAKRQQTVRAQEDLAQVITKALANYPGPVVVESFDPKLLLLIRDAGYRGHLGIILMRDAGRHDGRRGFFSEMVLRHMLHWPMTRFSFMSCNRTDLDLPMVRFLRARGMPLTSWTVRDADQERSVYAHADQIVFEGFVPQGG
jgi:glycerophosphoryl diester phosphodiesterase